jgi:hypothetical protein
LRTGLAPAVGDGAALAQELARFERAHDGIKRASFRGRPEQGETVRASLSSRRRSCATVFRHGAKGGDEPGDGLSKQSAQRKQSDVITPRSRGTSVRPLKTPARGNLAAAACCARAGEEVTKLRAGSLPERIPSRE